MLTTEVIEKAIELFGRGSNQSTVVEAPGISPEEAGTVAETLYLGDSERLFREVALAGVLEAAAKALRSGRGLIGDGAGDIVREIWHSYPNAGLKGGEADRTPTDASGVDRDETGKRKLP
jgi:hypothetical protein